MKGKDEEKEFITNNDINNNNMSEEQVSEDKEDLLNDKLSDSPESLEEKYNELNNSYLRLHAEFDNYRKRTIKEKAELLKTAGERIFIDILPVIDDFERALDNISLSTDVDSVKEGVDLIYNKFMDFLRKNGVKKMDVIGKAFDTEKHDAVTIIPAENNEMKDKIVDVVQTGYELGDKVIRFPKVIVAK